MPNPRDERSYESASRTRDLSERNRGRDSDRPRVDEDYDERRTARRDDRGEYREERNGNGNGAHLDENVRESVEQARRAAEAPAEAIASVSDAWVRTWEQSSTLFGDNFRAMQDEARRFLTERLEEDAGLMQDFAKCRTLFDFMSVQQRWFNGAMRSYGEQWMRMTRLGSDLAERGEQAARER